jgi:hypothetical protein
MEELLRSGDWLKNWAYRILGTRSSVSPAILLLSSLAGLCICILINGLFINPTRHIPGPIITRFATLYFYYRLLSGSFGRDLIKLHEKYGKNAFKSGGSLKL